MGELHIVSRSGERFRDRRHAGQALAAELNHLQDMDVVVLGVPRGGIIVAREVAQALGAELDIVLAHKLRTPGHPELAMGSVAENGQVFLNEQVVAMIGAREEHIERERKAQESELDRRAKSIRAVRRKVPLQGRTVVVTDDGVATGATTQAALWAVRQEEPSRLVAGIPVGSEETVRRLAQDADDLVCLQAPPFFSAVGQFYEQFEPVEEGEVLETLRREAERAA
ncbi:MAG: phosphoribosyltransferase [Chloroflexota bacterium]